MSVQFVNGEDVTRKMVMIQYVEEESSRAGCEVPSKGSPNERTWQLQPLPRDQTASF